MTKRLLLALLRGGIVGTLLVLGFANYALYRLRQTTRLAERCQQDVQSLGLLKNDTIPTTPACLQFVRSYQGLPWWIRRIRRAPLL